MNVIKFWHFLEIPRFEENESTFPIFSEFIVLVVL